MASARLTRRRRLPLWLTALLGLAATLWTGLLALDHLGARGGPLDRLEMAMLDWRLLLTGPRDAPEAVAIVAIDDMTIASEGGYPLDRARMAALVDAIRESGARALAIDVLFADPGPPAGDAALAEALAKLPVVIAAAGLFETDGARGPVPAPDQMLWPAATIAAGSAVGLVNISSDANGTPRHAPLIFRTERGLVPALALRAAGRFTGSEPSLGTDRVTLGPAVRRLDAGWTLPLRFYGPRGGIATTSASALFGASDTGSLAGKLVFLGATATAIGDSFATPFDPRLPGVEVLATATANLLEGDHLVRDVVIRRIDAGTVVALGVGGTLLVCLLPLLPALAAIGVMLLGWLAVATLAIESGIWFAMALPLAGTLVPVMVAGGLRQWHDARLAAALSEAEARLRRLQPRALAARLADDPGFLAEPRVQKAAILFIDLAGFTGMSERLGASGTRALLKEFHTLVVDAAVSRGGVVLTFMGDGAMIVFGLPDETPDDAARALEAGFALIDAVHAWLKRSERERRFSGVRLGAHFGSVDVSRLGHDEEQHVTAIGDSVNVASRLMTTAEAHRAGLAVSRDLFEAAGGGFEERFFDWREVTLRGRAQPIAVGLAR